MAVSSLVEWCQLAREEDAENVLYANFKYEVNKGHVKDNTLKQFEKTLRSIAVGSPADATSSDYLIEASRAADLFYEGKSFPLPDEGVSRAVTMETFEREYKSFLNGIASGSDALEELYDKLVKDQEGVNKYITTKENQAELEEWAIAHTDPCCQ